MPLGGGEADGIDAAPPNRHTAGHALEVRRLSDPPDPRPRCPPGDERQGRLRAVLVQRLLDLGRLLPRRRGGALPAPGREGCPCVVHPRGAAVRIPRIGTAERRTERPHYRAVLPRDHRTDAFVPDHRDRERHRLHLRPAVGRAYRQCRGAPSSSRSRSSQDHGHDPVHPTRPVDGMGPVRRCSDRTRPVGSRRHQGSFVGGPAAHRWRHPWRAGGLADGRHFLPLGAVELRRPLPALPIVRRQCRPSALPGRCSAPGVRLTR